MTEMVKWYRSNDYNQKWSFYWVITWKLLFSGGINLWWGNFFRWRGVGWENFQLVLGDFPSHPKNYNKLSFYLLLFCIHWVEIYQMQIQVLHSCHISLSFCFLYWLSDLYILCWCSMSNTFPQALPDSLQLPQSHLHKALPMVDHF